MRLIGADSGMYFFSRFPGPDSLIPVPSPETFSFRVCLLGRLGCWPNPTMAAKRSSNQVQEDFRNDKNNA